MSASLLDFLSISTPLPATSFAVTAITGAEQLNQPYEYTVGLSAGTALLDPDSLLDKPVTVALGDPMAGGRYFSGIVRQIRQLPDQSGKIWQYELTLVPKLWFLGQTQDCRFFQQMTAPDIVTGILDDFSVTYSSKLQGNYTERDYTVQFNESYLHFIQRILEDEGIYYYFTHDSSGSTMVLGDQNSVFQPVSTAEVYLETVHPGFGALSLWQKESSTALGSVEVDDYNPMTAQPTVGTIVGQETTVLTATGAAQRSFYDWPAIRGTTADASAKAKWRMQAAEGPAQLYRGAGQMMDFLAGAKFTLVNDPLNSGSPTDYVIRSVTYQATDAADGTGGGADGVVISCTAFAATTNWREPPTAFPPIMAGIYSAMVIGPSGEEIYTDDSARIQVQFPADHKNDITTAKTLWVRVMQPWAGKAWGTQFTPRIGMEVAVAFLEADVNRPVVLGSLYNSDNTPVFATADKNKSGIRTHSTLNGGTANYNEFSFDDTKGSEIFFMHAEKDMNIEVENDRNVTVTKDEAIIVNGKKTDTVKLDHGLTVSQGDHAITVSQGNQSNTVSAGNVTHTISQGNLSTTLDSGNESLTVSSGSISHTAGQSITLQVGGNSIVISTSGITMTVGGNTIQMTESGVSITGIQVQLTGNAQVQVSGPIIQVSADGMLDMSGGITMINS